MIILFILAILTFSTHVSKINIEKKKKLNHITVRCMVAV